MCGAQDPLAIGSILCLEQHIACRFVAATFFPDFWRLKGWHEDFKGTGPVHFLSNNLTDFLQGPQTHGKKGIKASG